MEQRLLPVGFEKKTINGYNRYVLDRLYGNNVYIPVSFRRKTAFLDWPKL